MTNAITNVPGPAPINSVFGVLRFMRRFQNDAIGIFTEGFKKYGDLHVFRVADLTQYQLSHPDHIHTVLVTESAKFGKDSEYTDPKRGMARFFGTGLLTSNGEFWKRQRKLMQPAFHHKRIEGYAATMSEKTLKMIEGWPDGAVIDVDHQMMQATLMIVVKALFDADAGADLERVSHAMDVIQEVTGSPRLLPPWVPTPLELRARRALRDLDDVVYRLIRSRRAEGESSSRGDLLSMLLEARDDEGNGMTDRQIRDELVTLYLAGHETTANTLNWTWMLLAQHPEVEATLHAELDLVLAGRAPTLADLKALPYTEMVIKEAMRLYPPAFIFSREALEDVQVGGYVLPKGATVAIVSYITHRDPRWWGADADQFKPERFSPERDKSFPKHAYIPFGGGPRVCIGNMFAMMEAQLMLATIASRFTLRLLPGQVVEPDAKLTLRPKGGLPMLVQRRQPNVPVREEAAAVLA
jgi:cytochrome P450